MMCLSKGISLPRRQTFTKHPHAIGRELSIDPVTERSSDAEANQLFGKEYRQGYELPKA